MSGRHKRCWLSLWTHLHFSALADYLHQRTWSFPPTVTYCHLPLFFFCFLSLNTHHLHTHTKCQQCSLASSAIVNCERTGWVRRWKRTGRALLSPDVRSGHRALWKLSLRPSFRPAVLFWVYVQQTDPQTEINTECACGVWRGYWAVSQSCCRVRHQLISPRADFSPSWSELWGHFRGAALLHFEIIPILVHFINKLRVCSSEISFIFFTMDENWQQAQQKRKLLLSLSVLLHWLIYFLFFFAFVCMPCCCPLWGGNSSALGYWLWSESPTEVSPASATSTWQKSLTFRQIHSYIFFFISPLSCPSGLFAG